MTEVTIAIWTRRLDLFLTRLERGIASASLLLIAAAVLLQVFGRNVLSHPLPGTDESARLMQVTLTFVGAAALAQRREHVAMAFVIGRLGGLKGSTLRLLVDLCVVAALMAVSVGGLDATIHRRGLLTTLPIPAWTVYGVAWLGVVLAMLHTLVGAARTGLALRRTALAPSPVLKS